MKYLNMLLGAAILMTACKKNDGNNAPQIKFKTVTPAYFNVIDPQPLPLLTIQLKDKDGDIGFNDLKDTSYLYVKNISIAPFRMDSFKFPNSLSIVAKSSFSNFIDVELDLNGNRSNLGNSLIYASSTPSLRPRRDSIFFEVYVKDFKKNKSNVIKTDKPLVFITP